MHSIKRLPEKPLNSHFKHKDTYRAKNNIELKIKYTPISKKEKREWLYHYHTKQTPG